MNKRFLIPILLFIAAPLCAQVQLGTGVQIGGTVGGGGGVSAVSVATANGLQGTSSGGSTPVLTLNTDSTHVLGVNTGSSSLFLNQAGTYTTPVGTTFTLTTTGSSGAATYSAGVLNIPVYSGSGSMTWPTGAAGIPNYSGSSSWNTSYSATNLIPANFISTLNQSTTGNAATASLAALATALASTPTLCSTGQAPTGILANGNATGCASISGGGVTGSGTTGYAAFFTGTSAIGNSFLDYGVTTASTFTFTKPIAINDSTGLGGGFNGTEGTAPTGASGVDNLWADSTAHRLKMNNNNGGAVTVASLSDLASSSLFGVVKVDGTTITATGGVISAVGGGSVTFPWSCQPGLGDGLNVITAGTYLQTACYNDTGQTVTLTGLKCYADAGTPTMNATNGAGTGLLTGAITCSTSFAAGTQSGTTTIAAGDFIKFTFVASGTAKQSTFVVTGTHP